MNRWRPLILLALGIPVAFAMSEREASALEPLDAFLQASHEGSFDTREAHATAAQREEEDAQAKWKLAPTLSGSLLYTRNEYAAIARIPTGATTTANVVIQPQDQRDALITATIPIVDVGAWTRLSAANATRDSAAASAQATTRDVEGNVAKAYFQVVAQESVLASAIRSRETQEKNRAFVETRRNAGVGSDLDLKRAQSEVERARRDIADATYQVAIARRNLETLSGMTPSPGAPALDDDLHAESALAEWLGTNDDALPDVRAAAFDTRASEKTASAKRYDLLPTISISGTEHFTNATGFSGQSAFYQIVASAQIKLDGGVYAQARALDAAAAGARAREEKTRRLAKDRIFDAWSRIASEIDKARAARAEVDANELAADLARQRYNAGTATFLDVSVAERDLFTAQVARIQADADLSYSRADLRLAAGRRAKP